MALGYSSTIAGDVSAGPRRASVTGSTDGAKSANTTVTEVVTYRERRPAVVELDNLLRRRLRVNNPNDAQEVAEALGRAYPAEKAKLDREEAGLPFAPEYPSPVTVYPTADRYDLKRAMDDIERDLDALTSSSILEEVRPELRGWGAAIRTAVAEGESAAAGGLDPRQRERVFSHRRTLTDFARLARYVAALTPDAWDLYRDLAIDIDTAAASLLVVLGDTLAEGGVSGSRVLPQYPPGDLQARRDAVIIALRNLMGTGPDASAPDGWPRGILAHRQVSSLLQTSAFSDLRGLLDEGNLVRQLDTLIDSANSSNVESMRARASSAELVIDSLRRLILICRDVAVPDSPNLEAFRVALQQFVDPFEAAHAASGYRIPFIARPMLLSGRRGGPQGLDTATTRLINLTEIRQSLAENVDYFLQYSYADDFRVSLQIFLDACLQSLDRAIDLYALGTDAGGDGAAEWRAAAFGYLAYAVRSILPPDTRADRVAADLEDMVNALVYWWVPANVPPFPTPPGTLPQVGATGRVVAVQEELAMQLVSETAWFDLARRMAPSFVEWTRGSIASTLILQVIQQALAYANIPPVSTAFVTNVPRDVPTILHTNLP